MCMFCILFCCADALGHQLYLCELCSNFLPTKAELSAHYVSHHNLSFDAFSTDVTAATHEQKTPYKAHDSKNVAKPANGVIGEGDKLSSPVIQYVRLSDGSEAVHAKTSGVILVPTEPVTFSSGDEAKTSEVHSGRSKSSLLRPRGLAGTSGARRTVDSVVAKHARHPTNVVSVYPCPVCGKIFRCRRYLRKHSETHGSAHACDVCGKNYRSRAYLRLHRRRHEKAAAAAANPTVDPTPAPSRPRFSCSECNFTTDVIAAIHAHRQVHAPSGSVRCAICGRAYSNRAALSKHRRVHDTDRPFACPVSGCRWRFRTDVMCRAHVRAHTVAGRFRCSTCGYVFRRKHHLQRHEARMHQSTQSATATTPSRSAASLVDVARDHSRSVSTYQSRDVLLSSLNDVDTFCSPSDIYDTGNLITDDDDSSYRTLLDVSSDVICDKKTDNFIVDALELFQ